MHWRTDDDLPALFVAGNVVTMDEDKADLLNAFLVSVFNGKTSCSLSAQSLAPEVRDREWSEGPVIQERVVGELLDHLGVHESMELDGIHKGAESWWKGSLSDFPSFTSSAGWPGRYQWTEG